MYLIYQSAKVVLPCVVNPNADYSQR
jgi:hypothetical protein